MKSFFSSKTIWLAILQGVLGIIVAVQTDPSINVDLGRLLIAKSALDIVIRMFTDKPLTL